MKKIAILAILAPYTLMCQVTFNIQSDFGHPFVFLTSVLPTDTCIYVNGVFTDTAGQTYAVGNIYMKFDLEGNMLTSKKLSNPDKSYETWRGGLLATEDGLIASAGITKDSASKAFFMLYTASGDTVLTKEYFNPDYPAESFITSVSLEKLDGGRYYYTCGFNPAGGTVEGDIMVLKLDGSGNVLQQNIYGDTWTEVARSSLTDMDGGLIVGACKTNSNQVLKGFVRRTYIFKVDSLGNVLWEYLSPPGQLQDAANSMLRTEDGGMVVASGKGIEHPVNQDVGQLRWQGYVFKINSNLQLEWGRDLRGERYSPSTNVTRILHCHDMNGFVVFGRLVEDKSFSEPRLGSWMVKLSEAGDSLWARYFTVFDNTVRYPHPFDFKATSDSGYVIVGQTTEGLQNFGWLMKLDSHGCLIPGCEAGDTVSAAGQPVLQNPELAIYPNPAVDYLNFQVRGTPYAARQGRFRILDAGGREVKSFPAHDLRDTFIVPVWDWAAGVYFLHYQDGDGREASQKFLIVKK